MHGSVGLEPIIPGLSTRPGGCTVAGTASPSARSRFFAASRSNRDRRTLIDKMLSLLDIVAEQDPFYSVGDAYYAAGKIANGLHEQNNYLCTRVKSNAVAYESRTLKDAKRVVGILVGMGYVWMPLGAKEGNFGLVNIGSDPGFAFIEAVVNELSSPRAAVAALFAIPEGCTIHLAPERQEQIAQDVVVTIGDGTVYERPLLEVRDTGTGLAPMRCRRRSSTSRAAIRGMATIRYKMGHLVHWPAEAVNLGRYAGRFRCASASKLASHKRAPTE
jgi:hypothetical protein